MESFLCWFCQPTSQKKQRESTGIQWNWRNQEPSLAKICELGKNEQETGDSSFRTRRGVWEPGVPTRNGELSA